MPLEPEFRAIMTDTVTVEPFIRADVQGKPIYDTPKDYWARVDERIRYIRDSHGNQVVSMSKVSMDPTTKDGASSLVKPSPLSRITLPDGRQPVILSIGYSKDEVGIHHYVFYC